MIRQADVVIGCFLAVLGLFILYAASNNRLAVSSELWSRCSSVYVE